MRYLYYLSLLYGLQSQRYFTVRRNSVRRAPDATMINLEHLQPWDHGLRQRNLIVNDSLFATMFSRTIFFTFPLFAFRRCRVFAGIVSASEAKSRNVICENVRKDLRRCDYPKNAMRKSDFKKDENCLWFTSLPHASSAQFSPSWYLEMDTRWCLELALKTRVCKWITGRSFSVDKWWAVATAQ